MVQTWKALPRGMKILQLLIGWCYREDEPADERFRKNLLVPIVIVTLLSMVPHFQSRSRPGMSQAIFVAVSCACILLYIARTKTCTLRFTEAVIVFEAVNFVFVADFMSHGLFDTWSLGVVMMDFLLLCSCRSRVVNTLRNAIVLWIIYRTADQAYRFEFVDSLPRLNFDRPDEKCKLGTSLGFNLLRMRLFVFIADFIMTRFFAHSMKQEQARISSTVQVAERVADALVRFDLDLANEELRKRTVDMGEKLHDALAQLLVNLRTYRPYLPEALFESFRVRSDSAAQRSPPDGKVALVFTDIQASTALWEASSAGMQRALAQHNQIIRREIGANGGYEVKTIGDAFMVAFDTVGDACRFCFSVQEALYDCQWEEDILSVPLCSPVAGLWNGLRVRMGVHIGEMEMQLNPVTGRVDYFGPSVAVAARIEGVAPGGTVAITGAAYRELDLTEVGDPAVVAKGSHTLKGLGEEVEVFLLAPWRLRGRLADLRSELLDVMVNPLIRRTQSPVAADEVRHTTGSVVLMRLDHITDLADTVLVVKRTVALVVDAVERTGGVVMTMSSLTMVAGWNVGDNRVSAHTTQSAIMVGRVHAELSQQQVAVGVATGPILSAKMGTETQRFVVFLGEPLRLAEELAQAAKKLGALALAAAVQGSHSIGDDPSAGRITRRVDRWVVDDEHVVIFQLDAESVVAWSKGQITASWGWSHNYDDAFDAEDIETLEVHGHEDSVLFSIAELLRSRKTLQGTPRETLHY